jgi:Zn-dependent peptidase ImmA (M78 family)
MEMVEKLHTLNTYLAFREPPINVVSLANILGIKVYNAAWPDNVSGKIQKDAMKGGTSGFAIFVNKDHPKTRKRFTIAHELAHYILHEPHIGDGLFDDAMYRSGLPESKEVQANQMAADILMPWAHLRPLIGKYTPAELAQKFEVSPEAMNIRLGIFA